MAGRRAEGRRKSRQAARRRAFVGINCHCDPSTGRYSLRPEYVEAVRRAGGIPLLLPFVRGPAEAARVLERVDAIVFTGGDDPDPRRWGERPHPRSRLIVPEKQRADEWLAVTALRSGKPILGICYGAQLLNIVRGGSLHQHLPDLGSICAAHRTPGRTHRVEIGAGSRLHEVLGVRRLRVNSFHHQGVARLGNGLNVSARAEDGIVEGIETAGGGWVIGVQWHPERMLDRKRQHRLFEALIRAARS